MRGWVKSGLIQVILSIPLIAGVAPSHAEELKFGVAPGLGETEMRAELEPLLTYLSGALGRMVSLYIAKVLGDNYMCAPCCLRKECYQGTRLRPAQF